MPINNKSAITVYEALKKHMETIPLNRKILMGGDWNVTLEETDRKNHIEKRTILAKQLYNLINTHGMIDVWRTYHPENKQFTFQGNQITSPKSRLDRIYIKKNWLQQSNSIRICPYFIDHAVTSTDFWLIICQ